MDEAAVYGVILAMPLVRQLDDAEFSRLSRDMCERMIEFAIRNIGNRAVLDKIAIVGKFFIDEELRRFGVNVDKVRADDIRRN